MSIFNYNDYKPYLQNNIRKQGKAGRGTFGRLAVHLGVHPTLISQVISGEKDFTIEQALPVAEFFGLRKLESNYFLVLVQIARAGTHQLKTHYREIRNQMQKDALKISERVETNRKLTDFEKSIFYSSWLFSAIQIATSLDHPMGINQLCDKFHIPLSRAHEIINFLLDVQMLEVKNGRYQAGSMNTHLEKGSPFLIKHHVNWRVKAIEKAESVTDEELMYTVNLSLNEADFKKLREELVLYIQSFLKTVKDSPAEMIAQLNIDFFKL